MAAQKLDNTLYVKMNSRGRPLTGFENFKADLEALLSAITTGGSQESYTSQGHNRRAVIEYLLPFKQSAWLCGMRYLPPFVLYSYHTIQDVQLLRNTAQQYRRLLEGLRDERIPADALQRATYLSDLLEELE